MSVVAQHRVRATGKFRVKTTHVPQSKVCLDVEPIRFRDLWKNYVGGAPHANPNYKNQCAIRLSATLHRVGVPMKSFSEKYVPRMPGKQRLGRDLLQGKPVALRAYEMATWLKQMPFCGLPRAPRNITGPDWKQHVRGRTGIIYFFGYWRQDGDGDNTLTGGHIDLWNGSRLTIPSLAGAVSTLGRWAGLDSFYSDRTYGYSDLSNSVEILFWDIR
ncbi:type VI secretion system amidase effector protein Tae4 [Cupriavidus sp. DL-D2]|uniref:type VI secretion system amidase effector protein Tae4 n=1 Tax=Cupriavidus sp. DL-D2 TaxID=3144974 RepID=UPI003215DEE3